MTVTRKRHNSQTKIKVALEAIKGEKTTAELTAKYGVHASQISSWKKQALEVIPEAFSNKRKRSETDQQALIDELYKQIGQLTVERDWLKKNIKLCA
jgi:transposase